jgi:hypothetical protein
MVQLELRDVELLQESVPALDGRIPAMVRYAYDRFAEHPDTRPDFLADRELREATLVNFLQRRVLAPLGEGRTESLANDFYRLGIIHAKLGMSDALIRAAGGIFVDGMARESGAGWDERYSGSWTRLFQATEEVMLQGAHVN